ncbi:hypothetical protein P9112_003378 [Eukaryota sp. TZLM1-RC]
MNDPISDFFANPPPVPDSAFVDLCTSTNPKEFLLFLAPHLSSVSIPPSISPDTILSSFYISFSSLRPRIQPLFLADIANPFANYLLSQQSSPPDLRKLFTLITTLEIKEAIINKIYKLICVIVAYYPDLIIQQSGFHQFQSIKSDFDLLTLQIGHRLIMSTKFDSNSFEFQDIVLKAISLYCDSDIPHLGTFLYQFVNQSNPTAFNQVINTVPRVKNEDRRRLITSSVLNWFNTNFTEISEAIELVETLIQCNFNSRNCEPFIPFYLKFYIDLIKNSNNLDKIPFLIQILSRLINQESCKWNLESLALVLNCFYYFWRTSEVPQSIKSKVLELVSDIDTDDVLLTYTIDFFLSLR